MQDYRLLISKSTGGGKGGIAFVEKARCSVDLATWLLVGLQRILKHVKRCPDPSAQHHYTSLKNKYVCNN